MHPDVVIDKSLCRPPRPDSGGKPDCELVGKKIAHIIKRAARFLWVEREGFSRYSASWGGRFY
ncbi:hypothetical protein DWW46_07355 [Sutterella sp. AF15-45LB]|nr:hypothetical protein DWW46_07355 [Sutterella sp. AF15-45LB]RGU77844.1 hypothetical protein DWW45_07360 [Sutterella sp. AF15-44LB]RHH06119.1 hypothetical protein DW229_06965 [Sutterella sp. AM18-8-1]